MSAKRAMRRARMAYLEAILRTDASFFDSHDPTSLPSTLPTKIQSLEDGVSFKAGMILMLLGQSVCGCIIALVRDWKLALVVLSGLPIVMVFATVQALMVARNNSANQSWYAQAGGVAEEVLLCFRTVVAFGGEEREIERYKLALKPAKSMGIKVAFQLGNAIGLIIGIFTWQLAIGVWFGGEVSVKRDDAQASDVLTVLYCVLMVIGAINNIAEPFRASLEARAACYTLIQLVDHVNYVEPSQDNPETHPAFPPAWLDKFEKIEFKDVHFAYPSRQDVPILKGLNAEILAGQKVAFVGESGSGKSTSIQLLERFYDPDLGEVLVNGHNLKEMSVLTWRQLIGYVGQEPFCFASSIRENIRAGDNSVTDADIEQAAGWVQLNEMLATLPDGLDTFVGAGGGALSGGQKQRVAIARALVKQPAILLLDEATSALDNTSEKEVQAVIDKLSKTMGGNLTTISIAHRLSTIRNSDVIFFLANGKVAEKGSHKELLLAKGGYYNLVRTQEEADGTGTQIARGIPKVKVNFKDMNLVCGSPSLSVGADHPRSSTNVFVFPSGSELESRSYTVQEVPNLFTTLYSSRNVRSNKNCAGSLPEEDVATASIAEKESLSTGSLSESIYEDENFPADLSNLSSRVNVRTKLVKEGKPADEKEIEAERARLILKEAHYKPNMGRILDITSDVNYLMWLAIFFGLGAGVVSPLRNIN